MQNDNRRKFFIIVIGIISVLLLVSIAIFGLLSIQDTNSVISTSPRKATVEINGTKYSVNSTKNIYLEPGEYSVTVTAKGFYDKTSTIIVKDQENFNEFGFLLDPESEDARTLLLSEDESEWRDIVGQLEANNFSEILFERNPLLSFLPKIGAYYRVDYALNPEATGDNDRYIVWITTDSAEQEAAARDWIVSVDSRGIYDVRVRSYAQSPSSGVSSSPGWEPIGIDSSDPSIVR